MNRKLLFALSTILLGITQSSTADDKVIVSDENGEKVSFLLSSKPVVSFDTYDLVLKTDQETVLYPLTKFRSFSFETIANNVSDVDAPLSIPTFSFKNCLEGSNLEPSSKVMVFNITGILIAEGVADKDGRLTLPINTQKNSICIVSTSVGSFKVYVRYNDR